MYLAFRLVFVPFSLFFHYFAPLICSFSSSICLHFSVFYLFHYDRSIFSQLYFLYFLSILFVYSIIPSIFFLSYLFSPFCFLIRHWHFLFPSHIFSSFPFLSTLSPSCHHPFLSIFPQFFSPFFLPFLILYYHFQFSFHLFSSSFPIHASFSLSPSIFFISFL